MTPLRASPFAPLFASMFAPAFALLLGVFSVGAVEAAKKEFKPPDGVKVASGQAFDIYVVRKESKPFAATSYMLNIFASEVVVHQTRRTKGRQRYPSRKEAIDADLLDPAMWQVGDFDGDGYDDYRFVAHLSKKGCRTWSTWLWLPDKERFTLGAKIKHQTDANGKSLKVCL